MPYTPPNYASNANPGEIRRRIFSATMDNRPDGTRLAIFHEADMIRGADGQERVLASNLQELVVGYDDPNTPIELRHPITDAILGQSTLLQALTLIYSLGRHAQKVRDDRETARIAALEAQP